MTVDETLPAFATQSLPTEGLRKLPTTRRPNPDDKTSPDVQRLAFDAPTNWPRVFPGL